MKTEIRYSGAYAALGLMNDTQTVPRAALFPHSQRRSIGLTITLSDIAEHEFRTLGLIEIERH